jgi:hypothetical protein
VPHPCAPHLAPYFWLRSIRTLIDTRTPADYGSNTTPQSVLSRHKSLLLCLSNLVIICWSGFCLEPTVSPETLCMSTHPRCFINMQSPQRLKKAQLTYFVPIRKLLLCRSDTSFSTREISAKPVDKPCRRTVPSGDFDGRLDLAAPLLIGAIYFFWWGGWFCPSNSIQHSFRLEGIPR